MSSEHLSEKWVRDAYDNLTESWDRVRSQVGLFLRDEDADNMDDRLVESGAQSMRMFIDNVRVAFNAYGEFADDYDMPDEQLFELLFSVIQQARAYNGFIGLAQTVHPACLCVGYPSSPDQHAMTCFKYNPEV